MREYRIAYFTADWNYELVESTMHGLKRFVEDHENVHLCVFDCFGKDMGNAKDRIEYAIFELADLGRFDGLLIQGNQIVLKSVRETIAARVARTGIPAVSIDCPIPGCTLIGIDNELAQRDITNHVIRCHGARKLVYLTGILDNGCPEGRQRLNGFLNAARDNGVPEADIEVVECTWRTSDGARVARQWLQEGRPLPDAFICGNDEMALGIIETLEKAGLHVPANVIVTGFDNLPSAELSRPRLSTVSRDYARLNYKGMQVLLDRIDGNKAPEHVPFDHDLILSESCGCGLQDQPEHLRGKYFQQTRFLKNFYALQDEMAERLFDASTLLQLMDIVDRSHQIFGCENVYLCVNDYYYDNYEKKQWQHDSETFGDEMILTACGEGAPEDEPAGRYARFPTHQLLPEHLMRRERFLVFYPLHYKTYSIGYIAMNGISEAAKLNLHESIFSFLEIAIENVRKRLLLRQFNEVLDNLYVHDALTGLYNRFGFERFGEQTFSAFRQSDGGARVLFVDMDDMKGINDRFGHEAGDDAIRAAARILEAVCGPRDFLMRYGGDEFLIIASVKREDIAEAVASGVEAFNRSQKAPFHLGLSVGDILAGPDQNRTLEECVQAADTQMYRYKKRHRCAQ